MAEQIRVGDDLVKLQFLGANRQVTGSRYFLDLGRARLMIDCGMFQERKFEHRNWDASPVDVSSIDAVLLTHAHIDHCGLLPRMYSYGCKAPIFATKPTVDLTDILLRDAAEIQMEEQEWEIKVLIKTTSHQLKKHIKVKQL